MAAERKQFKRITLTTETMEIEVPVTAVMKLDVLAERLTDETGIETTVAGAVGFLIRQFEKMQALQAQQAAANEQHFSVKAVNAEGLTQAQHEVVGDYMRRAMKIEAIKYARSVSNMGLKEAKDYVERHFEAEYQAARNAQHPQLITLSQPDTVTVDDKIRRGSTVAAEQFILTLGYSLAEAQHYIRERLVKMHAGTI